MATFFKDLGGLLLEWPGSSIQKTDLLKTAGLHFQSRLPESPWELFTLRTSKALLGEDTATTRPPFEYSIVCRRSGQRMLVLSVKRSIVQFLLDICFEEVFTPRLKKVFIAVDKLVKDLSQHPLSYALSFAHARVPAFGTTLRAVSFYGDDLAEASMFREQLDRSVFFTCGLRETHGSIEIVRLRSDAALSFRLNASTLLSTSVSKRLKDVETILGFLQAQGYLSTDLGDFVS